MTNTIGARPEERELIERARKWLKPVVMVGEFDDDDDELTPTYPPPSKHNAYQAFDLIESLISDRAKLREVLEACRAKFAEYVRLHSAKLLPERTADEFYQNARTAHNNEVRQKVAQNQWMVDLCDAALNTTKEPGNG